MRSRNAPRQKKEIEICARCGKTKRQAGGLVKSCYIPRVLSKQVFMTSHMHRVNIVKICSDCKELKAQKIVIPEWYKCLPYKSKQPLYMLFGRLKSEIRTYILDNYDDYDESEIIKLNSRIGNLIDDDTGGD